MLHFAAPVTLRLDRGRLLSWPRQSAVRLRVVAGMAWVTQADDPEDHFLQAGQALRLRPGARALIEAEQDVSMSFETEGAVDLRALLRRLRAALGRRSERASACKVQPAR